MRVGALVLTVLVGMSQFLLAGEPPGPVAVPETRVFALACQWRWGRGLLEMETV